MKPKKRKSLKKTLLSKMIIYVAIIIVIITLAAIFIPMIWPYDYANMLGVVPGKPVDEISVHICKKTILRGRNILVQPEHLSSREIRVDLQSCCVTDILFLRSYLSPPAYL